MHCILKISILLGLFMLSCNKAQEPQKKLTVAEYPVDAVSGSSCIEHDCESLDKIIVEWPRLKKGFKPLLKYIKKNLGHYTQKKYQEKDANGRFQSPVVFLNINVSKEGIGKAEEVKIGREYNSSEKAIIHSLQQFFEDNKEWKPLKLVSAPTGIECVLELYLSFDEEGNIDYSLEWKNKDYHDYCTRFEMGDIIIK